MRAPLLSYFLVYIVTFCCVAAPPLVWSHIASFPSLLWCNILRLYSENFFKRHLGNTCLVSAHAPTHLHLRVSACTREHLHTPSERPWPHLSARNTVTLRSCVRLLLGNCHFPCGRHSGGCYLQSDRSAAVSRVEECIVVLCRHTHRCFSGCTLLFVPSLSSFVGLKLLVAASSLLQKLSFSFLNTRCFETSWNSSKNMTVFLVNTYRM